MSKLIDLTNKKFGSLTVLNEHENRNGHSYWLCLCDCGSFKFYASYLLRTGRVSSCGCERKLSKRKASRKRLYNTYQSMLKRCYNANIKSYKYYGAKGITVCDSWKNDFNSFYEWSMQNGYEDDLSIDRIDYTKGYSPANCRWITMHEQQQNKSNCIFISNGKETHNIATWCNILGIDKSRVRARYHSLIKSGRQVSFDDLFSFCLHQKSKHGYLVNQYTTDGILVKQWDGVYSTKNAGFNPTNVSKCCNHKRRTSGGYIWRFDGDPNFTV